MASISAAVAVPASAICAAGWADCRTCPSSRASPNRRETPLTSSSTSEPKTWKRGVKADAVAASAATGTAGEWRAANIGDFE